MSLVLCLLKIENNDKKQRDISNSLVTCKISWNSFLHFFDECEIHKDIYYVKIQCLQYKVWNKLMLDKMCLCL